MTVNTNLLDTSIIFEINGQSISAHKDESILQVAQRYDIEIPHLCYSEKLRPDGNCRACVVEIEGERTLAPSCCRMPSSGMVVKTNSTRARNSQQTVLELLFADAGTPNYSRNSLLQEWCQKRGVVETRFPERPQPLSDTSHPAIAVNLDACIQCSRCVRACREEQANDVIGYAYRGGKSKIVFDFDNTLEESSCVACGECVQACPTGALSPSDNVAMIEPEKKVSSVCPYCGVGCQLVYNVKDNKILTVEGRDGPANLSRLCVKGRYGFDYVHHRQRLTVPLIRREGRAKRSTLHSRTENPLNDFREASWEEAFEKVTHSLLSIKNSYGSESLAGFGSAKGSNEEAYLFQKLIRTGLGTNNVDHCTRLCHASSVSALLQMIGSAAVSNPVADVSKTDVILLIGSNPTENHPVAATFFKNALKDGASLIVMDPRKTTISRFASQVLQFKPDTDVAMLNAIMHSIIEHDLVDSKFIATRTEGYNELKKHLQDFSPESMEAICGVPAKQLHEVARVFATAQNAMIFWGMGVSQHTHGTDNARCLINLSLISGQIGRPGTGLHPLRGQNNVQGASDAGLIPMLYPDYQAIDDNDSRKRFESLWQQDLNPKPGLTVVEIMHAAFNKDIRGMYIMGENPAMSDPNLNHARAALAKLDHLIVQDIFLTETAQFADVILPASAFPEKTGTFTNTDRRVQLGRQALTPPGDARQDLHIIIDIGKRLGLNWNYTSPEDVFNEMRLAMPSIAGISWERLESEHSVTYPCENLGDRGEDVIFKKHFPIQGGRAKLMPSAFKNAVELPDADFPLVLITGRLLEHWHTGSMTRRASVLDALEPTPVAMLHPESLAAIGLQTGDEIQLETRRGSVVTMVRADRGLQIGQVFLPFCYREAAANLLTNDAIDPEGKIPEFKFCALRIKPVDSSSITHQTM